MHCFLTTELDKKAFKIFHLVISQLRMIGEKYHCIATVSGPSKILHAYTLYTYTDMDWVDIFHYIGLSPVKIFLSKLQIAPNWLAIFFFHLSGMHSSCKGIQDQPPHSCTSLLLSDSSSLGLLYLQNLINLTIEEKRVCFL